jgi:hypothetical protein
MAGSGTVTRAHRSTRVDDLHATITNVIVAYTGRCAPEIAHLIVRRMNHDVALKELMEEITNNLDDLPFNSTSDSAVVANLTRRISRSGVREPKLGALIQQWILFHAWIHEYDGGPGAVRRTQDYLRIAKCAGIDRDALHYVLPGE